MVSNALAGPGQPAAAITVGCWQSTCGPHRRLLQINGNLGQKALQQRGILTEWLTLRMQMRAELRKRAAVSSSRAACTWPAALAGGQRHQATMAPKTAGEHPCAMFNARTYTVT
jgi:hypothetical protein